MTRAEVNHAGWVPDASTFGARLALIRQRMGWNIKEAALACALPPASWRHWEGTNAQPRGYVDVVQKIASRTGCDELWLMRGSSSGWSPTPDDGESPDTPAPGVTVPPNLYSLKAA